MSLIKKKKVMLDVRMLVTESNHGIARYTQELISHLKQIPESRAIDFILLVSKDSPYLNESWPSHFKLVVTKWRWMSFGEQFELFWIIFKIKPDYFHSLSFIVPLLSSVPLIITLHDLNHVVFEEHYGLKQKIYYKFFLTPKLIRAQLIITISNFSKNEIIKYLYKSRKNINIKDKIHVIYNGVSSVFFANKEKYIDENEQAKLKSHLPEQYIFAVGNSKPHKNLIKLVQAYCTSDISISLIILSDNFLNLECIAKEYTNKKILFINHISEDKIASLYKHCSVFVYPSLYEGFGLPPLEAMACGVPVAASNLSSMPEILGQAALYFDPHSITEIQQKIKYVLSMDTEQSKAIRQAGILQAGLYSWSRTAQETLNLYLGL